MSKQDGLTRRGFVAANVAAATMAIAQQAGAVGIETSLQSGAKMGGRTDHDVATTAPANWRTASADQLEPFVGDRFRISMQDGRRAVLKLVEVVRIKNGADWPANLPRSASVIAVFDSPDKAMLVACGCATLRFRHSKLGTAELYTRLVPTRSGDHSIEVILA
jgi:hypothetical protein